MPLWICLRKKSMKNQNIEKKTKLKEKRRRCKSKEKPAKIEETTADLARKKSPAPTAQEENERLNISLRSRAFNSELLF